MLTAERGKELVGKQVALGTYLVRGGRLTTPHGWAGTPLLRPLLVPRHNEVSPAATGSAGKRCRVLLACPDSSQF